MAYDYDALVKQWRAFVQSVRTHRLTLLVTAIGLHVRIAYRCIANLMEEAACIL